MDDEIARRQALEDVARDDPTQRLRSTNTDRAEELAVGHEGDAVRTAAEAAVEASTDERDGAGRRRRLDPIDDRHAVAGLVEDLGKPRRLIRREHDPGAILAPRLDGIREATRATQRQRRLAPAEQVARAAATRGHRDVARRFGLPGQLQGPRGNQPGLPVTRWQVAQRPVLGQLASLHQLGPPLIGLPPQERRSFGDVARLIEHEDRARVDVVETRRRGEVGGPDLGGVADREGPRRLGGTTVGSQRVVARPLEPGKVPGEPLRQSGSASSEAFADRGHARGREQEFRRGQEDGPLDLAGRALVGGIERPQRVDLIAEELDADRQLHRWREHVDDATATRELAPTGDLGDRAVPKIEQLLEQRVLVEPRPDRELTRLVR